LFSVFLDQPGVIQEGAQKQRLPIGHVSWPNEPTPSQAFTRPRPLRRPEPSGEPALKIVTRRDAGTVRLPPVPLGAVVPMRGRGYCGPSLLKLAPQCAGIMLPNCRIADAREQGCDPPLQVSPALGC